MRRMEFKMERPNLVKHNQSGGCNVRKLCVPRAAAVADRYCAGNKAHGKRILRRSRI